MKKLNIVCVMFIFVLFFSTAINADIISTAFIETVTYDLLDEASITGGGFEDTTFLTGIYSFGFSNVSDSDGICDYGFRTDLSQAILRNKSYYVRDLEETSLPINCNGGQLMTEHQAYFIRELWGKHFDPSWLSGGTYNRLMGEAFGVAIWEILYETDGFGDVTSGAGFSAQGVEFADVANDWLAGLGLDELVYNNSVLTLTNIDNQGYVLVPEPMTMLLLALGSMAVLKRK